MAPGEVHEVRILNVGRDGTVSGYFDCAEKLAGGPLRGKRGRAFWRHGNGYKVAIDQERGVWYHHVTGVGGGPK